MDNPRLRWSAAGESYGGPFHARGGVFVVWASQSLVLLAIALTAGGCSLVESAVTTPPSPRQQAEEVAALQSHVLPLVRNLRVTWYLNDGFSGGSMEWRRGGFSTDRAHARDGRFQLFDNETAVAFKQFASAIHAGRVPVTRLSEARFAEDGTVRFASFMRRGGGITYVYTYIYSPGAKPPEWKSKLGPVVLTRIGKSDWWFEQSPDD